MKISLIYNPASGNSHRLAEFLKKLPSVHRCELRSIHHPDDPGQFAREAIDDCFDRIVIAGGDGTVNAVVNGLAPDFDSVDLAILPSGTGNDLGRTLNLPFGDIEAMSARVFDENTIPVDIIQIRSNEGLRYCVNVANGGIGGHVAADVDQRDKRRWGSMAYWITSVSQLVDLQCYDLSLNLDGRLIELNGYGVAVANGCYVGGGFPIAPRARLGDGLLDVTVVPMLPPVELMAAGFNFALRRDEREDRIHSYQAKKIVIQSTPSLPFSVDGEPVQQLDSTFEILPGAVRMVSGPEDDSDAGEGSLMMLDTTDP